MTKSVNQPIGEMVDCERCGGKGGPDLIWDEDLGRHMNYICGWCGGNGVKRRCVDAR
ncbi:MAG: hypothetical protein ACKV2O_14305 [Acidimicrobiales bacterium]